MSVRRLTEEQVVASRERLIGTACEIIRQDGEMALHFQNALASLVEMHHGYLRAFKDHDIRCPWCGGLQPPHKEGD